MKQNAKKYSINNKKVERWEWKAEQREDEDTSNHGNLKKPYVAWTKWNTAEQVLHRFYAREVQGQAKLTYGDRNRNSGCERRMEDT